MGDSISVIVFKLNMAFWDRAMRMFFGVVFFANFGAASTGFSFMENPLAALVLGFFGMVLIVTSALGHSPTYSKLGWSTK